MTGAPGAEPKRALRRALLAARRARADGERRAAVGALVAALPEVLDGVADPVCLFVPVGTEPGAPPDATPALPRAALALGRRVLLPVTVGDAPLDWAAYDEPGALAPGPHGLLEPTGPRLGPAVVGTAGLVLVPALAVDRAGVRLGRGGGHYDRTLALRRPGTRLVALVGDDELVDDALPAEAHDVTVDAVWRPHHGVTELGH